MHTYLRAVSHDAKQVSSSLDSSNWYGLAHTGSLCKSPVTGCHLKWVGLFMRPKHVTSIDIAGRAALIGRSQPNTLLRTEGLDPYSLLVELLIDSSTQQVRKEWKGNESVCRFLQNVFFLYFGELEPLPRLVKPPQGSGVTQGSDGQNKENGHDWMEISFIIFVDWI